jgi:hypothetical protein
VIRIILQSAVTGSLGYPIFDRVRLPEVNDSSYFAECANRKLGLSFFLRVQLPEVNDSYYFAECGNQKLGLSYLHECSYRK